MSRTRIQMSRTQSYPPLFPFEGDTVAKVARVTDSLSHLNVTNLDVCHELIYVTNSSRTVAKGARVANSLTQMSHTQSFPTHFFFWWCCCERRDLFYINFTNSYPIVTNSKKSPPFFGDAAARGARGLKLSSKCHELIFFLVSFFWGCNAAARGARDVILSFECHELDLFFFSFFLGRWCCSEGRTRLTLCFT